MNELYKLPNGWEWKKLSDVGNIITGNTPSKKKEKYWNNKDGEYLFIKPPHLGMNKIIYDTEEKLTKEGFNKAKPIPKNSIMVCCIGSLGKIGIAGEKLATNQQINSVYFNDNIVDFKYGYYFALTLEKKMKRIANKAVVSIINKTTFSKIEFPLPSLKIQQKIVSKLDMLFEKIDNAIALLQSNIEDTNNLLGSVLDEVFGEFNYKYKKEELGKIIKIIGGGTPSKKEKTYWDNGNIKWATVRDMNVDIIENTELSITEKGLNESSSNIVPKEGIIIATRVGLGKVCYLTYDTAINQDLKGLLPLTTNINIKYLYNFFKNKTQFIINNGQGATVKGVKLDFIKQLKIPLPPLKTQEKTVEYLDKISKEVEKLKKEQTEKLNSLIELKASILDKAFKGEL